MVKPLVVDYLQNHTLEQLEAEHGVKARPNASFDKLTLNYDQLLVKSGDPVAEQCRGLVVRPTNILNKEDWDNVCLRNLQVLGWPMNRFYNAGDAAAAPIDWSDPKLRVYEKLDGTMIVLYWDQLHDQWHAATRSVSEADLPVRCDDISVGNKTFSDLFWEAYYATTDEVCKRDNLIPVPDTLEEFIEKVKEYLPREYTYVFELTGPHNRVVVRYDKPKVTLLAMRRTDTGEELVIEDWAQAHMEVPKAWPINNLAALTAFVDAANPWQLEGAVVIDSQFRRLKVKNEMWVLSSRARDMVTTSRRSALECIILGKDDDIIQLLPDNLVSYLQRLRTAYVEYCRSIDVNVSLYKLAAEGSRKLFAQQVIASGDWTPPYFNLWEGRAPNAHAWINGACEKGKLSDGSLETILSRLTMEP